MPNTLPARQILSCVSALTGLSVSVSLVFVTACLGERIVSL